VRGEACKGAKEAASVPRAMKNVEVRDIDGGVHPRGEHEIPAMKGAMKAAAKRTAAWMTRSDNVSNSP
jgi:hypothetical protein